MDQRIRRLLAQMSAVEAHQLAALEA